MNSPSPGSPPRTAPAAPAADRGGQPLGAGELGELPVARGDTGGWWKMSFEFPIPR